MAGASSNGAELLYVPLYSLKEVRKKLFPNLPLSAILNLTPCCGSQAKTLAPPLPGSSYELRSQGPPTLGAQVLDTLLLFSSFPLFLYSCTACRL